MKYPCSSKTIARLLGSALAMTLLPTVVVAQALYNGAGSTYTQSFNNGYSSGSLTWADNSTVAGWYIYQHGRGGPPPSVSVVTSTASASGLGVQYLVAAASETSNFALGARIGDTNGSVPSTSGNGFYYGLRLRNNTSVALNSFRLSFTGVQFYRGTATVPNTITTSYQVGSPASLIDGTWTDISGLTYTSVTTGGPADDLDFNVGPYFTHVPAVTVSGVNWAPGSDLWIRFRTPNVSGSDSGVGIDNVTFRAQSAVSYGTPGATYAQNFNNGYSAGTLTWAENATIPGWYIYQHGRGGPPPSVSVKTSTSDASGLGVQYLVSASTATSNFALGARMGDTNGSPPATSGNGFYYGLHLVNDTGATLNNITIGYTGVQFYRGTSSTVNQITTAYQIGTPSNLIDGTWTSISGLTYSSVTTSGPEQGTNFNSSPYFTNLSPVTISGVSWGPNEHLWVRFRSNNVSGLDSGIGIDNVTVSAAAAVPSAPTAVIAISGDTEITLQWEASPGATSYTVGRRTTSGSGTYTTVQSGITGTTFTDTGRTNGTNYYYVVTATNAAGTSGNSNQAKGTPYTPVGTVRWPLANSSAVDGDIIRHSFGPRINSGYDFHAGIDIPCPANTPIYAVMSGTVANKVTWDGSSTGAGNNVLINHGNGRFASYLHLNSFAAGLDEGDTVSAGQLLGLSGKTGAAAYHLHFTYMLGLTSNATNESRSRTPLEILPHSQPTVTASFRTDGSNLVDVYIPAQLDTIRWIILKGEGQTKIADYYDIVAQGSSNRNTQSQYGIYFNVASPTIPYDQGGGTKQLIFRPSPVTAFTAERIIVKDFNGNTLIDQTKDGLSLLTTMKAPAMAASAQPAAASAPALALSEVRPPDGGSFTSNVPLLIAPVGESPAIQATGTDDVTRPSTGDVSNLSVRAAAGGSDNPLVVGFVVRGTATKTILVRAIGSTLADFAVGGGLADPKLSVFRSGELLAENNNWNGSPVLANAFNLAGAFPLAANSNDAAMILTLPPGVYTAQIANTTAGTGATLVEIYEVP